MGPIILEFAEDINASAQVGDTLYFTDDANGDTIQLIGEVSAIAGKIVTATIADIQKRPTIDSFILFSKTAKVNTSNLKGYYAEMQFKNNSLDYSELFLVGSQVFESSK